MHDLRDQLRPHIDAIGQSEAARRSGIPRTQINQWLGGARGLPLERQIDLARAIGLDVEIRVRRARSGNGR